MRFLHICPKPPWPPIDGGSIAMWNLMEGLHALGHEVQVVALNTSKQYCHPASVPEPVQEAYQYALFDTDIGYRALPALLSLFDPVPYHVQRFHHSEMERYVAQVLAERPYDYVVAESLYAAPIARIAASSGVPVVMRAHNAEHVIWRNLARAERNPIRRSIFSFMARRICAYELQVLASYHACACISQEDIAALRKAGSQAELYHAPLGIEIDAGGTSAEENPDHELYHIGSMEWLPHREAMAWFLTAVWPAVHAADQRIRCHLAGQGIGRGMRGLDQPGIVVHTGPINARAFARHRPILIAPSFSGSGVMVKVVEAMALGKTILTTPNGARGLSATHDRNMIIAERPQDWVKWIVALANDRAARKRIGESARRTALDQHERTVAARTFLAGIGARHRIVPTLT